MYVITSRTTEEVALFGAIPTPLTGGTPQSVGLWVWYDNFAGAYILGLLIANRKSLSGVARTNAFEVMFRAE